MPTKAKRKVEVDPDLLRRYLDLVDRARATDREVAELLTELRHLRARLRLASAAR